MIESDWLVFQDQKFLAEQCRSVPLPGYLVVRPRTQVRTLSALPDKEASDLGVVLRRVVRAIDTVVRPIRVYVAQFGEEDQNLHFHLFPRTETLTREYLQRFPEQHALIRGPLLLDWARERFRSDQISEDALQVLGVLRSQLGTEA